MGLLQN